MIYCIAYNHATGNFYITGKYWNTLCELDLRAGQLSVPIRE
ncbi:glutaminyl-peptide cyclotransferase [Chitinophaga sp. XS-30]|nr:glutaminyl-peptide cyclotransferase [Chitinophaga sp. XS-30]